MTLTSPPIAPVSDWDPLNPVHETDPTSEHSRLRHRYPVAFTSRFGGFYTLSRYEDILSAAADTDTFISGQKATIPDTTGADRAPRPPLEVDPPRHREFRTLLNRYFAPRRIRALEPVIRDIARELISSAVTGDAVDAVTAITYPMPSQVVCAFLGIPKEEAANIKWMANNVLEAAQSGDVAAHRAANDQVYAYIDALVEDRERTPHDPESDPVTGLLMSEIDGRSLTREEVTAVLRLVLQAGHGTTTNALGSTIRYLAEHPEEQRRLREDHTLIAGALEEILRMNTPARLLGRTTSRDVTVAGRLIPAGSKVALMWSSANRDAAVFERPDELIIDRRPNRHVAFGHGIHTCLGAPLARAELRIAVEELFAHTERIEIAGEVVNAGWPHIGPAELPVRLLPREQPLYRKTRARGADAVQFTAEIIGIMTIATDVVEVSLRNAEGDRLPRWAPGAHVELDLPNGASRQYSFSGDREERDTWRIAVLRERAGRGGSAYIHDELRVGDRIVARGPRNNFPLRETKRHVFLASGIGITPMLPMIAEATRRGDEWELHYVGRNRAHMAYAEQLAADPRVRLHVTSETGRPDLARLLHASSVGTTIYACGSPSFLEAAEAAAAHWPAGSFTTEHFAPKAGAGEPGEGALEEFDVELSRSGVRVHVEAGRSIIDACAARGVTIPGSCFEGTCGSCETPVLVGEPDHRDSVLTDAERERNEYIMPCVSRSRSAELVLDA